MIKALAFDDSGVLCDAGKHWSDQFGGCVSDSITPTPVPKPTWVPGVENWMVIGGAAMLVLVLMTGKKK